MAGSKYPALLNFIQKVVPNHLMQKKLFKAASFAVIFLALVSSILFGGSKTVNALSNPLSFSKEDLSTKIDKENKTLEIVIEPSIDNEEIDASKKEMSMEDIFGSEQVFPFEPGLGNGGRSG